MKGPTVTACLYLMCFVLGQNEKKVTYNGNQLWKITKDKETMNLLATLEKKNYLTIWGSNSTKTDAMIHSSFLDKVKEQLSGKHYEILVEDVQKAIDEENPKPIDLDGRKSYRITWDYYHNLNDIYDYLHYLEQTFPKICTVYNIGRSVEGRPIKLLKISNGKSNKAIFIEGGIHAREWISPAAVTYIIHQIVSNFDKEPLINWYIVPVLNPDGYEYSYYVDRLWRKNRARSKNCIGVDLNRNWGYNWGKNGSSGDPCNNMYRGRRPFSEPETAAVANFFLRNPDIDWIGYIAFHAYGQYIVYPWGSTNAVVEDYDELNKVATEAALNIIRAGGESYTVGPAGLAISSVSGISMDWAKGAQAIKYTYTIRLRDTGRYGYILPAQLIKPTSEEALVLLRTITGLVKL